MKIAIDLQGYQSLGSKTRGIGRYSFTFIRTLLENSDKNDEFIVVANKSLGEIDEEFHSLIKSNISQVQYFEWTYPDFTTESSSSYKNQISIAKQIRSYAFSLLNCDVILITSFFEGFKDTSIVELEEGFDLPPIASIFYDLIPLIEPELYLDKNPLFKEFYLERIAYLEKLDCLLSISKSAASEAYKYLAIDKNKIHNIYAGCDRNLFTLINTKPLNCFKNIKIGEYILYSGAGDPRKNLERLIHAYSLLDKKLIISYKLVLVGNLLQEEISLIKSWISSHNLSSNQVVLLGYVSDEELADLYRHCKLFIFPSLHEGFGLPALEAMSCGAVVLGSKTTSIPEVIQNYDALFDPRNTSQIASLITKALTNEHFYNSLAKKSIVNASKFSWDKTVKSAKIALNNTINSTNKYRKKMYKKDLLMKIRFANYDLMIDNITSILVDNDILFKDEIYLKKLAASINLIELNSCYYKQFEIDDNVSLSWQLEGPFDSNYSLAILNREFSFALSQQISETTIKSTEGPGNYEPNLEFLENYPSTLKLYENSKNCNNLCPLIVSRNLYPPRVNDMFSRINMLHAYGWEESEIPQEWINDFNKYLDGITVMSYQVKKTLIDCGFEKPISICGLGVDHLNRSFKSKKIEINAKKYKFLHISSCFPRKGTSLLLESYGKAFNIDDDVSLIIKTFKNPHNKINELVKGYKNENPNYPHLIVIERELSLPEIKFLYQYSDAYISPGYGEGFGLPLAEAMLFSKPVITTNWGGQLDFCRDSNSWLVDFKFEYSQSHFEQFDSVWAVPLSDSLAEKMQSIRLSTNSFIQSKVDTAKHNILNNFTWEQVSSKNIEFVKKLLSFKPTKKTKIAFVSSWNTKCGIASYVSNLVQYIEHEFYILAPYDNLLTNDDKSNVFRCWDINRPFTEKIKNIILELNLTSIVIQFNYGFYDFSSFNDLISFLYDSNIKITIFIHSTCDPLNNENKLLSKIKYSLSLAERLMVHTCTDLNRLKNIGLVSNVSIFPHGIKDFVKEETSSIDNYFVNRIARTNKHKYKLATTGFCLPNKGFLELITSISILLKKDYDIHLTLLTPSYSKDYDFYVDKLKKLIHDLNLKKSVYLDLKFYDDQDISYFLSEIDLVIYPYQESNESSSASVRQGIASGSDVIVTPISIFEDVTQVVNVLPGITPSEMASGIENWIEIRSKNKSFHEISKDCKIFDEWRVKHRFSNLSKRLSSIITSIEVDSQFNN